MNTKNVVAVLMATIIAMALITPMGAGQGGDTGATVENEKPFVCCKWEEDEEGFVLGSLFPDPEGPVTVTVYACVCDPNGNDPSVYNDIKKVTANVPKVDDPGKRMDIDLTYDSNIDCDGCTCAPATTLSCIGYKGEFEMGSCDPSGIYTVTVTAEDNAGAKHTVSNEFEYISNIVLVLEPSVIEFGTIKLSTTTYAWGRIHNKGNDKATVTVTATDMIGPYGIISAAELDVNRKKDLSGDGQTLDEPFKCCVEQEVEFSIHAPFGTPPGRYVGTITLSGTQAECTDVVDLGQPPYDDCNCPSIALPANWDWSINVATRCTNGNYGGIGECGARMLWGANNGILPPGNDWAKVVFEECDCYHLQMITVRHLDGIADDSFDVFVMGTQGYELIGHYAWSEDSTEFWVVSHFPVEECIYHCPVDVKLVPTNPTPTWWGFDQYGLLAIDWIKMTCCPQLCLP